MEKGKCKVCMCVCMCRCVAQEFAVFYWGKAMERRIEWFWMGWDGREKGGSFLLQCDGCAD